MNFRILTAAARRHQQQQQQQRRWNAVTKVRFASSNAAEVAAPEERFTRFNSTVPATIDHASVLATPLTRITTLPNGLRVATESNLLAETATLGVWINAGSRYETAKNNGTAHFLEHMIFKGTAKRSMGGLEEEIENMGAHLNAYTSREQTTYYAKVLKKDVRVGLEILADILQNSEFNPERINRERKVILREMQEVGTQLEEVIFDHLHATAYQNNPLGWTILGPEENINSISQKDIKNYIATHYSGPRMVVVASGAVEHGNVVELVESLFTNLSTNSMTAEELVAKKPAIFTGSDIKFQDDEMPVAHFAVAVEGASWTDPDSIALMVMQTMLGSWTNSAGAGKHMGSELARTVAAGELADSFMAFNTNYMDTGLFGVYAVSKPDKVEAASAAIIEAMAKLGKEATDDDVARARNQLKACLLLHLDGTSPIAEDIGRQLLTYGRRLPHAELFARVDAVDVSNIKRVAERFIQQKDIAIAGLGSVQNLPDHSWFKGRLRQF